MNSLFNQLKIKDTLKEVFVILYFDLKEINFVIPKDMSEKDHILLD